jgi:hypothetical protein
MSLSPSARRKTGWPPFLPLRTGYKATPNCAALRMKLDVRESVHRDTIV